MERIVDWLDRSVERLAKWLNDNISGQHPLSVAAGVMSGVDQAAHLPIDRRIGSNFILMADRFHKVKKGETVIEIAKKYGIKNWKKELWEKQSSKFLKAHPKGPDLIFPGDELVIPTQPVGDHAKGKSKDCGFWALCGMSGDPCTRCGGDFGFDGGKHKCPSGSKQGAAWYACCADPGGTQRALLFYDCCTVAEIKCGSDKSCSNRSAADWCKQVNAGIYHCTNVEHQPAQDKAC